jgi:hypothetical protein
MEAFMHYLEINFNRPDDAAPASHGAGQDFHRQSGAAPDRTNHPFAGTGWK